MVKEIKQGVLFTLVTMVLLGGGYNVVSGRSAGSAFPAQAEGSLIRRADGTVVGSRLIAQKFTRPEYFQPRPSGVDYNAASTGGTNYGPSNPDHLKAVQERLDAIDRSRKASTASQVPSEMVTASGAGLDPHIPPAAAELQARARRVGARRRRRPRARARFARTPSRRRWVSRPRARQRARAEPRARRDARRARRRPRPVDSQDTITWQNAHARFRSGTPASSGRRSSTRSGSSIPRIQFKNPVMFIVEVGSLLTTIVFIQELTGGTGQPLFTGQVAFWLWFTVLFANFAEAMAEGRGKAQADTLRKTRTETVADRLTAGGQTRDRAGGQPAQGRRRPWSRPASSFPATARSSKASPSVDESAITGESAPVIRESGGDRSAVTGGTRVHLGLDHGARSRRIPGTRSSIA